MPNFDFLTMGAEFEVFRIGFFPGWGRAGIIEVFYASGAGVRYTDHATVRGCAEV